jgi:hypothetical protein
MVLEPENQNKAQLLCDRLLLLKVVACHEVERLSILATNCTGQSSLWLGVNYIACAVSSASLNCPAKPQQRDTGTKNLMQTLSRIKVNAARGYEQIRKPP